MRSARGHVDSKITPACRLLAEAWVDRLLVGVGSPVVFASGNVRYWPGLLLSRRRNAENFGACPEQRRHVRSWLTAFRFVRHLPINASSRLIIFLNGQVLVKP